jgi:NAD(P)-dependent dehydrogenase (short-subunit alcohol dehydrogenase family)
MATSARQVVFITGAASGLGRQLALLLAADGAAVAAIDLEAGPLEQLAAELPSGACAWEVADVTDAAGLRRAAVNLEERLGPIDLLIANAGIGRETSALDFRAEDFEALVRVNLIGVGNSVAAVLPEMLARCRGHLVGISSLASYRGLPHMAGYCASKAGVNSLLEALRIELRPCGIAVTTVCPGWIRTPMTANLTVPMPGILEVENAARRILAAVRRKAPFVAFPGGTVRPLRLLRWLPAGLSDWLLARKWRTMTEKSVRG